MNEAQLQARIVFDDALRARIRKTLRRYMAEHRIGTPALQTRIIEADAPRHREIPLSTLQRFLRGRHQTQEHHVALCHDFAKALEYFEEGAEIAALGEALRLFFTAPGAAYEQAQQDQDSSEGLAGFYHACAERQWPAPGQSAKRMMGSSFDVPYSRFAFTPSPAGRHVNVMEKVFNPGKIYPFFEDRATVRHTYEGAVLRFDGRDFILMRHTLTRAPKTYWVLAGGRSRRIASGTEAAFLKEDRIDAVYVQLERTGT